MPTIIKSVQAAIDEKLGDQLEKINGKLEHVMDTVDRDRVINKIMQDKLEQYSRRENIKILGVKENEDEDERQLIAKVVQIAQIVGSEIKAPISTAHRIGKKSDKTRPIIVRFTARQDKNELMKKKKALKDNGKVKNSEAFEDKIVILDDITEPRKKLLKMVRDHKDTEFAFVREGNIIVKSRQGRFHRVENADDLFHLGFNSVSYRDIYGSE